MSAAYLTLLMLVLTPLMANGRPAASTETVSSREPRQMMMPAHVQWIPQPAYGYRQYGYGQNPFLSMYGPQFNNPINERFGFALLAALFGGGDDNGGEDGGEEDRNPWQFRPLANLQRPFSSSMAAVLG